MNKSSKNCSGLGEVERACVIKLEQLGLRHRERGECEKGKELDKDWKRERRSHRARKKQSWRGDIDREKGRGRHGLKVKERERESDSEQ